MSILAINSGSSSIKFALYRRGDPARPAARGEIEVGSRGRKSAARGILKWAREHSDTPVEAIGHRFVHGGPKSGAPRRLTRRSLGELRRFVAMDPEHLPDEIELAEEIARHFPGVPQFACFDTSFHWSLPAVARLLPIPRRYERKGIRRYGFHGLSYGYLLARLREVAGKRRAGGRIILAHLGSGCSLAAVKNGRPFDTTMAFTPAAGIPMASRSGDLDPGLVAFLARSQGMSVKDFDRMVTRESGLLGLSETSGDVRDLLRRERKDRRAAEAIALFCYRVAKEIGALAAGMGGLDAVVFSGGIGQHSPIIRARICRSLAFLGVILDPKRNRAANGRISGRGRVPVWVIPTDEESVIAQSVARLVPRIK